MSLCHKLTPTYAISAPTPGLVHCSDWKLCHWFYICDCFSYCRETSCWRVRLMAPHLCFVCIIKETRSKLMERYRPKLLRRKQGTMSNLRLLLVSVPPQSCISSSLITVIYIFLSHCPWHKPLSEHVRF